MRLAIIGVNECNTGPAAFRKSRAVAGVLHGVRFPNLTPPHEPDPASVLRIRGRLAVSGLRPDEQLGIEPHVEQVHSPVQVRTGHPPGQLGQIDGDRHPRAADRSVPRLFFF